MKKSFAQTFACIAVFSIGFANTAYSQVQDSAFRPVKAWEVGELRQVSEYSGECALQNEFNNGFILQFTGSSNWVQKLNINFRQNVFDVGEDYQAQVTVPGNAQTTLAASASKPNILSIPLKGQKEFFKASRKNAVIDVSIEGNYFRFYLTGFAEAAHEFERCMAGATPQDADAQAQTATNPNLLANESIAFEEAEMKSGPNGENAELPAATGEEIPYSEGHAVIQHSTVPTPSGDPQKRPDTSGRKRLSEQLANEIASNPELIQDGSDPVKSGAFADTGSVAKNKDMPLKDPVIQDTPEASALEVPPAFKDTPPIPKPAEETTPASAELPEPTKKNAEEAGAAKPGLTVKEINGMRVIQSEPILEGAVLAGSLANKDDEVETAPQTSTTETDVETVAATPVSDTFAEAEDASDPVDALDDALLPMGNEKEEQVEAKVIETAKAVEPKVPEKKTYKSADIKVKTERHTGEADFSKDGLSAESRMDTTSLARISTLEQELEMLRAENQALNDELDVSLREGEKELLAVSSENWNLERATMRYNEAERQIKRLGQQLQKDRAQCTLEKKELEMMLFDPEVTEQAQLARLSQLEKELAEAKATIKALEASTSR